MKTCCFIGHRKIEGVEELYGFIRTNVERLIKDGVDTFLFGSKSMFDNLCLKVVSELKKNYPYLSRICVRAEFEYINQDYEDYLLEIYDATYFCEKSHNAGRLTYVVRNHELIDKSDVCVFYYNEDYRPKTKHRNSNSSGTKLAYDYACKKKKQIINCFLFK